MSSFRLNVMHFFEKLEKFERIGLLFFTLFIFLQCISNAAANIALGIAIFFLSLQLIFLQKENNSDLLGIFWKENKNLICIFSIFWFTIFLSAIFSADAIKGLKIFFGQFVYRTAPLFVILYFFRELKFAKLFLILCILSCSIDVIGSVLHQGIGPRLGGFFGSPMTLAGFLIITIPILFCSILEWKQKTTSLVICIVFFTISFLGLLLNVTRGAWLAVAITLPIISILYDRSLKKILFLIAFIVATSLVFMANPHLQQRAESITSTTFQSNTERLLMWNSALHMLKDHPAFGVGIGQYAEKYINEYRSVEAKEIQRHCHNNFLQMLAENGLIGFLGFVFLFGYLLIVSLVNFFRHRNSFSLLIFGVTLDLMLQGLTEYNFGNSAVIKFYWTVLGCLLILMRANYDLNLLFLFERKRKNIE